MTSEELTQLIHFKRIFSRLVWCVVSKISMGMVAMMMMLVLKLHSIWKQSKNISLLVGETSSVYVAPLMKIRAPSLGEKL